MSGDSTFYKALLAAFVLLSIASLTFTAFMNPYGIYTGNSNPDQSSPVDLFWHVRLYKPYVMAEQPATHLLIGSSRTGRMVPAEAFPGEPAVYNASLPGITPFEMYRQIEHAQALAPLKSVVIGLEYYMFRADKELSMPGFSDDRLLRADPGVLQSLRHLAQVFVDRWATLFSRSAMKDSLRAVIGEQLSQRTFNSDGSWDTDAGEYKGRFSYNLLTNQKYSEFRTLTSELRFGPLEALLDFLQQHNIEVTLLISPSHAHILNAIELTGKFQDYRDWQRALVRIAGEYEVQIFGLETNRELLLEPISADAALFHDGVHYTRSVGIEISRCLPFLRRQEPCPGKLAMVPLNQNNIEAYLDTLTRIKQNYRLSNPGDYELLHRSLARSITQLDAAEASR